MLAIAPTFHLGHEDYSDSDRIGVNFAGSLVLHGVVAAVLVGWAVLFHHKGLNWGENASNAGAIQATMVASIPLPPTQRTLDAGVLTSETPSPAPVTAKEKTEPPPSPKKSPSLKRSPSPSRPRKSLPRRLRNTFNR